jgi:hypothetical protein
MSAFNVLRKAVQFSERLGGELRPVGHSVLSNFAATVATPTHAKAPNRSLRLSKLQEVQGLARI